MHVSFERWTGKRRLLSVGTNSGAQTLPFQTWHNFKEAFAPELIARAISESDLDVQTCVDPFGGSGTSALACQFLGVHPITIEVNPFLADLVVAKLSSYDIDHLLRDMAIVARKVETESETVRLPVLPTTFVEPGKGNRWLFDRSVADRIFQYQIAINSLEEQSHRRFFRVLLGGCLIHLSNVLVNGKGRRYRSNWRCRTTNGGDVDRSFFAAVYNAVEEVRSFSPRLCTDFAVAVGDCREVLPTERLAELCVCSPPYPNSFDYTDIYNVELWMLGYLSDRDDNLRLREKTLCSHVQVGRTFPDAPTGSRVLNETLGRLSDKRGELWDRRIPDMLSGYFADMVSVLQGIANSLVVGGTAWIVIGDSRYSGVLVSSARILEELMPQTGLRIEAIEPCRSMRSSPQQGGQHLLREQLLILKKFGEH